MSKHTPEPFEIRLVHTSGRGQVLLECHRPSDKHVPSVSLQFPVEIAERIKAEHEALAGINPEAVPDLLAACKQARELIYWLVETFPISTPGRVPPVVHNIVSAIAKAEAQP
jgi:hypothetical protein